MSFQTPITIKEAIDNIENSDYFLPAIQREFEWSSDRIEWIFDSLMQGYPISSFLFWSVEGESVSDYRFYKFLHEYRERFKIHNETANVEGKSNFVAILDGQQRLDSSHETGVVRWMKPGAKQFQIEYLAGKGYEPDFVVETGSEKFIVEVKAKNEMTDEIVLAKARAACEWVGYANNHADENGGKKWSYALIPHDEIKESSTLAGLIATFRRV